MKCSICNKSIETTFLNKIIGTYVKDTNGKLHGICFGCQKKFTTKEGILNAIR